MANYHATLAMIGFLKSNSRDDFLKRKHFGKVKIKPKVKKNGN